jgi:paraquat-inducible protein B
VWLIPLAALAAVAWLSWSAWVERGFPITVTLADGYGLKVGDSIRHRGIEVGLVRDVGLSPDLQHVVVRASLHPWARGLAREGARFWVVRPEVGLHRVSGLETVIGARYLAMAAAQNPTAVERSSFIGAERRPLADADRAGSRRVVLSAARRGGLVSGSPVTYRQIPVGVVVGVELAADATAVDVTAVIDGPYAALVRDNSKFWMAGGFDLNLGLKGFTASVDSFESFVAGGIAFATPDQPGAEIADGTRFELLEEPEKDWLRWQPSIKVGAGSP